MVKPIATAALAVALLASIAAAEQPHWYSRSVRSADSYLALREEFEAQFGRELSPFEARDVAHLVERNWKEKLAKKAVHNLKKHHGNVGDHSSGSQEQDRREIAGSSFYTRELDFDSVLLERSWVEKFKKWRQESKEKKAWKHSQHHNAHQNFIPSETPTTRELGTTESLYGRDLADFVHKYFHPYGDLKGVRKDEKKEKAQEGAQIASAPAPDAARRALYADSMDVMTRSYYGFDDMD